MEIPEKLSNMSQSLEPPSSQDDNMSSQDVHMEENSAETPAEAEAEAEAEPNSTVSDNDKPAEAASEETSHDTQRHKSPDSADAEDAEETEEKSSLGKRPREDPKDEPMEEPKEEPNEEPQDEIKDEIPEEDNRKSNSKVKISQTYHANPKLPAIKKKDGEPLWRREIYYDLLVELFDNPGKHFTDPFDPAGEKLTYGQLYVKTMANSGKCSKVLKDKLLTGDWTVSRNTAMVCFLVNVGRMNTTLNFFPEMRAQLRTYHSIPVLQVTPGQKDHQQLQDAPRLKSILKAVCDDTEEPATLQQLTSEPFKEKIPHTNPINLLFMLCSYTEEMTSQYLAPEEDFIEIFTNDLLTVKSRVQVFLWFAWLHLESDFSDNAVENNPFGPGREGSTGTLAPSFVEASETELAEANQDTPEEKEFGAVMRAERRSYLGTKAPPGDPPASASRHSQDSHVLAAHPVKLRRSEAAREQLRARSVLFGQVMRSIMNKRYRHKREIRATAGPLVLEWDKRVELPVSPSSETAEISEPATKRVKTEEDGEPAAKVRAGKSRSDDGEFAGALTSCFHKLHKWLAGSPDGELGSLKAVVEAEKKKAQAVFNREIGDVDAGRGASSGDERAEGARAVEKVKNENSRDVGNAEGGDVKAEADDSVGGKVKAENNAEGTAMDTTESPPRTNPVKLRVKMKMRDENAEDSHVKTEAA